jgi:hypothetical protein
MVAAMITANDTANSVARHDPGLSREALAEIARDRLTDLEVLRAVLLERSRSLAGFARETRWLAGYFHLLQPDAHEVAIFLRLMARAVAADAARTLPGAGPVRVDLGETGPLELPPHQEEAPDLRQIVDAFHAALAAGDRPALDLLAGLPLERLAQTPPAVEERAYGLSHARGLQTLVRGDIAGNDLLLDAIKGCGDTTMSKESRDYALFLVSPEIELALIHGNDGSAGGGELSAFDAALRNALVLHRRYWTEFGEANDPKGFIALGPLAWATVRRDRGLAVAVTSDYLPRSVMESHRDAGAAPGGRSLH